jgi:hypothetical protein
MLAGIPHRSRANQTTPYARPMSPSGKTKSPGNRNHGATVVTRCLPDPQFQAVQAASSAFRCAPKKVKWLAHGLRVLQ